MLSPSKAAIAVLLLAACVFAEDAAKDKHAIQLETKTGTLFGTVDLPAGNGQWPVVMIFAGSGPTDRDGNQPALKNDSLKMLGHALAAHGVAALRYDKRAIAASRTAGPPEEELRFQTYVDDAAAWVKQLRQDSRFSKIGIAGHSEGSLIGILAAKRADGVDAFISLEGAGRPASDVLREQLKKNLSEELDEKSEHIIDELTAGRLVKDVPADLAALFRPSVQPYLISWMKIDPAKEIADLKMPILIVQGTTDLQVTQDDAKRLADANQQARLVVVPNMNHVLKHAIVPCKWVQLMSYIDPSDPLELKLTDAVVPFLDETLAAKKK